MKAVIRNINANGFIALLLGIFSLNFYPAVAQSRGENLNEAKVASYTLPDLLKAANGETITSAKEWTESQRLRVLKLFAEHVYGKFQGKPKGLHFHVIQLIMKHWGEGPSGNS